MKCKNNSYLLGNDKTKCLKNINIEQYYTEDGISYYLCNNEIENCNKCLNKKTLCLECKYNYFFIGKDRNKCIKGNDIENNKYILEDDGLTYNLCSDFIDNCVECKNKTFCKKCEDNYYIVLDKYNKESCQTNIEKGKYYIENNEEGRIIYHSFSEILNNCDESTDKENCVKFKDDYFFIGN